MPRATPTAPHRHAPLADRSIRALSPKLTPIDVRDGGQPGLVLTVLPSGRKQFTVRYRFQGKQRRQLLGEYPAVTLAIARKRARKAQSAIDDGRDIAGERQDAKAARTDTVATLAEDYLRKHAWKFKRSAAEDKRILDVEVLSRWRDRSVHDPSIDDRSGRNDKSEASTTTSSPRASQNITGEMNVR